MATQRRSWSLLLLALLSTCNVIASQKVSVTPQELRNLVTQMVKSELASMMTMDSTIAPSSSPTLKSKLEEIQQNLNETSREQNDLLQRFQTKLAESGKECKKMEEELLGKPMTDSSANPTTSFHSQVREMSLKIRQIKDTLEGIETRVSLRGTSSQPSNTTRRTIKPRHEGNYTWSEFDELVAFKEAPKRGPSFNGSTSPSISQPNCGTGSEQSLVVEFVNHLDQPLNNFQLYDPNLSKHSPAPDNIPGNTKEIFTFCDSPSTIPKVSFSYRVSNSNVRVVAFLLVGTVWSEVAIGFLQESSSPSEYYGAQYGKPSLKVPEGSTKRMVVRHEDLLARVSMDSNRNAIAKIEVIGIKDTHISTSPPSPPASQPRKHEGNYTSSEFDQLVALREAPKRGSSFNGSTTPGIPQPSCLKSSSPSLAVEFVNYLSQPLKNFRLFNPGDNPHSSVGNIPGNTEEILAFCSSTRKTPVVAFSYSVSDPDVQVGAYLLVGHSWNEVAVGFLEETTSLDRYYHTHYRKPSSRVPEGGSIIVARYGDLLARVSMDSNRRAIAKIEVIGIP